MKTSNKSGTIMLKPATAIHQTKIAKATLALAFVFTTTVAGAQANPANRLPSRTSVGDTAGEAQIEETLVALALKGPTFETVVHQGRINEFALRGAKNAWMNLLTLSANYNEFSLSKNTAATVVYPRYFFGVTVPLGTLLSRTQVKAAAEAVEINKLDQEDRRRTIRSEVLSRYKQYKAYSTLIALQNENLNDVEAALLHAEESFRNGKITIENYNTAQRTKSDALEKLVNLRLQQDIVELEIEKMIGTSLESVIKR